MIIIFFILLVYVDVLKYLLCVGFVLNIMDIIVNNMVWVFVLIRYIVFRVWIF